MDWALDPVSGCRAPSLHWSLLDPLDLQSVGDSKVVWELNRHQWMVDLGRAYRFTGEERYAKIFVRLASEWMRANPPGVGLNWTSSLEVALRLISWCWALFLFRDSRAITEEFSGRWCGGSTCMLATSRSISPTISRRIRTSRAKHWDYSTPAWSSRSCRRPGVGVASARGFSSMRSNARFSRTGSTSSNQRATSAIP